MPLYLFYDPMWFTHTEPVKLKGILKKHCGAFAWGCADAFTNLPSGCKDECLKGPARALLFQPAKALS